MVYIKRTGRCSEFSQAEKTRRSKIWLHEPLFPSIPIDHVTYFTCTCDVLINLLILDLRRLDGIDKCKLHATHVAKYEHFLQESCKISFHMYVDKDSKSLKWRDLTGPEKRRLFKAIKIAELFPRVPHATKIQEIWKSFQEI